MAENDVERLEWVQKFKERVLKKDGEAVWKRIKVELQIVYDSGQGRSRDWQHHNQDVNSAMYWEGTPQGHQAWSLVQRRYWPK